MDIETFEGNLETIVEASDILSVPEGAKKFVDIIGDEKLDGYGDPASNFDTQQTT